MPIPPKTAPVVPRLEVLETREAPSVSPWLAESFDAVSTGHLPAGWQQWSSTGQAVFAVSNAKALGAGNSLASSNSRAYVDARTFTSAALPATLEVSAAVYLDNSYPIQVLARGTNLDSATPSFYALSVKAGLETKIVRVENGVITTLALVNTAYYLSNQWVRVTLSADGATLKGRIQRLDTNQFLTSTGRWQDAPADALSVTDNAITTGGRAGLTRPSSNAGTIFLDDFRVSIEDTQAPTLVVDGPSEGSTVTAPTRLVAKATDNVAMARVEFYVDGALQATDTSAPYQFDFDPTALPFGAHTLTILARDWAGNLTKRDLHVQTKPMIPQHFSHIRLAELAYSPAQIDATMDQLLASSVDLVISQNSTTISHIASTSPNTPQLLYSNLSTLYKDLLVDWLTYADQQGLPREAAFYHVSQATPFTGNSPSSMPVNWFWRAFLGGTALQDVVDRTRGTTSSVTTLGTVGQSLYLAYPDEFREINFNLTKGATGGWTAALEYATAVDAAGNPTAWAALTPLADTTNGLKQSGRITFTPPTNWVAASINGSERLFYVRVRTLTGGTAPIAKSVLGRDYVNANGTTTGVIPAFDRAADKDGDGYLNETEYANHATGKDARFLYESRAFYTPYGQMRFATNPSSGAFRSWAVDYLQRLLNATPAVQGVFLDNSSAIAPVTAGTVVESIAAYSTDYATLVGAVSQGIGPHWVMANTDDADVIAQAAGYYDEFALRPLSQNYETFEALAATIADRASLHAGSTLAVIDVMPTNGSPTDPRTQIAALASYYLLGDSQNTFLNLFGGFEPGTSWSRHYFPAIATDIGQAKGTWTEFARGNDPGDPALRYRVYSRSFDNALVLYKPKSTGWGRTGTLNDNTATVHKLDGTYRLLNADGTLSGPITSVSLRNGEGAILIKA